MSRLSSANAAAAAAAIVRPVIFGKFEFDTGTLYMHTGLGTYSWGSQSWLGVGDLARVAPVEEAEDVSPIEFECELSFIDSTLASEVLSENFSGRSVTLYQGFLDSYGALVADPDIITQGIATTAPVAVHAAIIRLVCTNYLANLSRSSGVLHSDASQQQIAPGDLFYEYSAEMVDKVIPWGSRSATFDAASQRIDPFGILGNLQLAPTGGIL